MVGEREILAMLGKRGDIEIEEEREDVGQEEGVARVTVMMMRDN